MIYHLNVNIGRQLTGIESAAIQRHKLLKEKYASKIVTIRYNTQLKETTRAYGLETDEYLNMYDYFQGATEVSESAPTILSEVFPQDTYTFKQVGDIDDYRVYRESLYIAYVHLNEAKGIQYINYFDEKGKKKKRLLFDSRGFLSCESILDENLKVASETYFSPKGQKRIEKKYPHDQSNDAALIKVYEGKKPIVVEGEKALITLFLDRLLTKEDVVISDKNVLVAEPLVKASEVGKRIAILHSKHYLGMEPMKGRISGPYREVFENSDCFDKIVCSTEQQRSDLIARFKDEKKFACIPVGIRRDVRKNRSKQQLDGPIRIGVVARYYEEKRLDHVIKAFKIIHSFLPNTELHLYGFGDGRDKFKTERELIRLTKQLNLKESVHFRGYLMDLDTEYKQMQVLLLTSRFEGFCLALLEGISYGIPAVSYDINYGPNEMIDSGSSGYLISNGCADELAKRVIQLVENVDQYNAFAKRAFEKSKEFSKESVMNKWEKLLFTEGSRGDE